VKGKLISENYGKICSTHFDPIEKKPLYHYFPGKIIFSIGSLGCNLHCKFCQNWEISQTGVEEYQPLPDSTPEQIVEKALLRKDNFGIAYTYNEPIVWYEFMLDTARLAQKKGLKNVMVTNGFINPAPLKELLPFIDAFSVDLKAFTDEFYKNYTLSRIAPIIESIKIIKEAGKHIELTNLVITEVNDDERDFIKMTDWIANEVGEDTVVHLSRYFPMYKLNKPATEVQKLMNLFEIAKRRLKYVYIGNVRTGEGQDTVCPNCGKTVISRMSYFTEVTGLDKNGRCTGCGEKILCNECI
jgi:pyruvate formate lyase activating enzyme